MNEKNLIEHYNKHNEDKRLKTKHAQIEFITAMEYIKKYIKEGSSILDVGAATGAYSIPLYNDGYDVTALELVKHNLKQIEAKNKNIKCILGNAINLSKLKDNSFDCILLFGPMYHLISYEEKLKALKEAKRVCKKEGIIFISYCMNEYAVITHAFKEKQILNIKDELDINYKIINKPTDLYAYVRLEDINKLKDDACLERIKIINQDGPAEYLKKEINTMTDQEINMLIKYHLSTCERPELLGAGRHILDILKKVD